MSPHPSGVFRPVYKYKYHRSLYTRTKTTTAHNPVVLPVPREMMARRPCQNLPRWQRGPHHPSRAIKLFPTDTRGPPSPCGPHAGSKRTRAHQVQALPAQAGPGQAPAPPPQPAAARCSYASARRRRAHQALPVFHPPPAPRPRPLRLRPSIPTSTTSLCL
jgi:hypothetical protein